MAASNRLPADADVFATGTGTATAIPRPSVVQAGDQLVFSITTRFSDNASAAGPEGSTFLGSYAGGNGTSVYLYAVTAGAETSYGYVSSFTHTVFMLMGCYADAVLPAATDVGAGSASSTTDVIVNLPAGVGAGDMVSAAVGIDHGGPTFTWTNATRRGTGRTGTTTKSHAASAGDALNPTSISVTLSGSAASSTLAVRIPGAVSSGGSAFPWKGTAPGRPWKGVGSDVFMGV